MISLPTGTKLMNWIFTILGSVLRVYVASGCLFVVLILIMFTLGGTTGIVLGNAAVDVALHDTYYVVGHFHFVLSLGAVVSIITGVLYFQDTLIAGLPYHTSIISIYYFSQWSMGVVMTFTPMHVLGYNYQPRRVVETTDSYNCWSYLSSMGSGITVLSMVVLLWYYMPEPVFY
jgi:cytochrome c oxidase subunit 1